MSKYRVTYQGSRNLWWLWSLGLAFGLLCILLIDSQSLMSAWWFEAGLLAGLAACFWWRRPKPQQWVASVGENGDWLWLSPGNSDLSPVQNGPLEWRIGAQSRVTLWLLWIQLTPKLGAGKPIWLWVFKDAVRDEDYRRLARIISRQQHLTSR